MMEAAMKINENIRYYHDIEQGSDEWFAVRCGLLTASEMKNIITPKTLETVKGVKEGSCSHLYELAAQRITGFVEPSYVSDDMLRGKADEIDARELYSDMIAPVYEVGFITNHKWGFTLGFSPDGLTVCGDGLIECKSRRQKFQIETILSGQMASEYAIQVQTGLLVTERSWCDFISYCGGLPMMTARIYADDRIQTAIIEAATVFHEQLDIIVEKYHERLSASGSRLIPTKRREEEEITL